MSFSNQFGVTLDAYSYFAAPQGIYGAKVMPKSYKPPWTCIAYHFLFRLSPLFFFLCSSCSSMDLEVCLLMVAINERCHYELKGIDR